MDSWLPNACAECIKKTLHASEQAREDLQQARHEWRQAQPVLDPSRLVFLDETWATMCMSRLRGRSPRGTRCLPAVPHGHWKTTTFVAGLHHHGTPMVIDGPMNGATFLACVHTGLCPTLRPGDMVIADNLSNHKVAGVRQASEEVPAQLRYLPLYSPDLHPIEKMFSNLKALLRKASARTVDTLWAVSGELLDRFTATKGSNYFASSGYVRK